MIKALESNDLTSIKNILSSGHDPNYAYGGKKTFYLHQASTPKEVQLLIQYGADKEAQDFVGYTPLLLACYQGDLLKVKTLLKLGVQTYYISRYRIVSVLAVAAQKNRSEVLRYLLSQSQNIEFETYDLNRAIMRALEYKSTESLDLLLKEPGIDPNFKESGTLSLTLKALTLGKLEALKTFISLGGALPKLSEQDYGPLEFAILSNQLSVLSYLFNDLNLNFSKMNNLSTDLGVLDQAILMGFAEVLDFALSHGAQIRSDEAIIRQNAWLSQSMKLIDVLRKHGIDINCSNSDCGFKTLRQAIFSNQPESEDFALFLLAHNDYSSELSKPENIDILHQAFKIENEDLIKALLSQGATLEPKTYPYQYEKLAKYYLKELKGSAPTQNDFEIFLQNQKVRIQNSGREGPLQRPASKVFVYDEPISLGGLESLTATLGNSYLDWQSKRAHGNLVASAFLRAGMQGLNFLELDQFMIGDCTELRSHPQLTEYYLNHFKSDVVSMSCQGFKKKSMINIFKSASDIAEKNQTFTVMAAGNFRKILNEVDLGFKLSAYFFSVASLSQDGSLTELQSPINPDVIKGTNYGTAVTFGVEGSENAKIYQYSSKNPLFYKIYKWAGTSYSAPQISGLIGRMLNRLPKAARHYPLYIRQLILQHAQPIAKLKDKLMHNVAVQPGRTLKFLDDSPFFSYKKVNQKLHLKCDFRLKAFKLGSQRFECSDEIASVIDFNLETDIKAIYLHPYSDFPHKKCNLKFPQNLRKVFQKHGVEEYSDEGIMECSA